MYWVFAKKYNFPLTVYILISYLYTSITSCATFRINFKNNETKLTTSEKIFTVMHYKRSVAKLVMATGHAMLINLHLNRLRTLGQYIYNYRFE
jgi:hypothetical protein